LITGDDPNTSVVDAQGKVHGLTGLYVVDGKRAAAFEQGESVSDRSTPGRCASPPCSAGNSLDMHRAKPPFQFNPEIPS